MEYFGGVISRRALSSSVGRRLRESIVRIGKAAASR
jgi:hypothetical protein